MTAIYKQVDIYTSIFHIIIISAILNPLYLYALYQTCTDGKLTAIEKILVTQSILELLTATVYLPIFVIMESMAIHYRTILYLYNCSILLLYIVQSFPAIVAAQRYAMIAQLQNIHLKRLVKASALIVILLLIFGFVHTIINIYYNSSGDEIMVIQLFYNLLLTIIYNSLLLHHVRKNTMPSASRTHRTERDLTFTIVIVNAVAILTTLPVNIYYIIYINLMVQGWQSEYDSDLEIQWFRRQQELYISPTCG